MFFYILALLFLFFFFSFSTENFSPGTLIQLATSSPYYYPYHFQTFYPHNFNRLYYPYRYNQRRLLAINQRPWWRFW